MLKYRTEEEIIVGKTGEEDESVSRCVQQQLIGRIKQEAQQSHPALVSYLIHACMSGAVIVIVLYMMASGMQ